MLRVNDSVHWFMNDLSARIIAQSGIPSDRYHLGKLIQQSFKDAPDFIIQIDAATGESETNLSIMKRSIQCAIALKELGLKQGDVMVLMAHNHVDVAIPFYAALYLGVIIFAVDRTLGVLELQGSFDVSRPKIVLCQSEKATDVQLALNKLDLTTQIVTFDKGDYLFNYAEFLENYGGASPIDDFEPADFNPETTIAFLIAPSGTTGLPKLAAVTHKNIGITNPYLWVRHFNFPTPTHLALIESPLQWLTAHYTRLQTSGTLMTDHVYHLFNEYRPSFTLLSPTLMTTLLKPSAREQCDITCLDLLYLGGSPVTRELIMEIQRVSPYTEVLNIYGMSELTSVAFMSDTSPPESCGKPLGCFQYRLVDPFTHEDVLNSNTPGELWVKGPGIFKEYYNNPGATEEAFAEDRWFKTGDMFYRDDNWNYYCVERIKLLLKYKSYQISPVEVERVIRQHTSVLNVAVTGIPDQEYVDLPVACVVIRPGCEVAAEDIKDLVKNSLSDAKQLRGGVIFVNAIPMTSTKVHRRNSKETQGNGTRNGKAIDIMHIFTPLSGSRDQQIKNT